MRLAALCLLALGATAAPTQDGLDAARARWETLAPERRAELQRRFDELRRMDAERRRQVESRFERLCEAEGEVLEELPEAARAELDALEPAERRRVARELAHEALLERSRLAREALPPPLRARLDGADADDVRRFVRERKRYRGPRSQEFERLVERLELSEEERLGLEALHPEQLEAELLERHRRVVERDVERGGLPPWVEPGEWERWRRLPEREFFQRFERHRRERGGGPPWLEGGPRVGGEREPAMGGAPAEGRAGVGARVRERVLEALERDQGLTPEALEELRGLEGRAFAEAVRRLQR